MTIFELMELMERLDACILGCGDVEYVLINNLRCATQDYIDAIHDVTGEFKPRVAYDEHKLQDATKGDKP